MEIVGALPAWYFCFHFGATAVAAWVALSTWRLSWPGSGYMGIAPPYWRRLRLQVAVAALFVVSGAALLAVRLMR